MKGSRPGLQTKAGKFRIKTGMNTRELPNF